MRVTVIAISDRAAQGVYKDRSGPEIENLMKEYLPAAKVDRLIVPDEPEKIKAAFEDQAGVDFIITTGGTGIGPRDVTSDVTQSYCDRLLPGIAEGLRSESYKETPQAMLSRGVAGTKGNTVIVNFPGSQKAVRLCTRLLVPIMEHAVDMMAGGGHG